MASLYGANHTKAFVNVPADKIDVSAWQGRVRQIYDEIDLSAVLALNDKVYMGRLPKGAKVVEVILAFPDLGTAGLLDVGYEYVSSADGTSDPDAFLNDVDVNTAAGTVKMSDQANMVGMGVEMAGEANIVVTAIQATTATSGKIKLIVEYVLD
jgi:hypothetical protein